MKTEVRVKVNPTMLDQEWFDVFQDQVLSIYLEKIRKLLSDKEGQELDPNKSYLEPMHFAAFSEQYNLAQLQELQKLVGSKHFPKMTAMPAHSIDELIESLQAHHEENGTPLSEEAMAVVFNCYPIKDPAFSNVIMESTQAGILGNFVHSIFLPGSQFRKPLMPEKANPFFMLASGMESRVRTADASQHSTALSDPETVWNLILSTPAGSKALMISRKGLTSSLEITLIKSTIEGEREEIASIFAHDDTLFDPKVEYKKFSDGETPLHPLFYPIFNLQALKKPQGPVEVLFRSDNDFRLYNASLQCLIHLANTIQSMDEHSAAGKVYDLILLGQSIRKVEEDRSSILEFIRSIAQRELEFFATPEVVMEMLMTQSFTQLAEDVYERIEQFKLTDNERARLVKSSFASDMIFGLLLDHEIIGKR